MILRLELLQLIDDCITPTGVRLDDIGRRQGEPITERDLGELGALECLQEFHRFISQSLDVVTIALLDVGL